jgi:hypothetical protein
VTVTNSEISGNSAASTGGGLSIDSSQSLQLTLTEATISDNDAGGAGANGQGGGIYVITEGTGTNTVNLNGGTISGNSAGGGGGDGTGGGVYLTEFDLGSSVTSSLTGNGTTFDGNAAGGEGGDGLGIGGAISATIWDVTLTGVTVSDNRAGVSDDAEIPAGFGGGISAAGVGQDLNVQGSLLTRNQASEASGDSGEGGGALSKFGPGNLTIADSAITDNVIGGPDDTTGSVRGGGLLIFEEPGAGDPSDSIVRSTFAGNQAMSGRSASGGGVSVATPGSISIDRSTFIDNTADGATVATGGGLAIEVFGGPDEVASLTNSTVHANRAIGATGLGVTGGFGGGVRAIVSPSPPFLISHSTITSNEAEAANPDSWGGNVYSDDPVELRATIVADGAAGDPEHTNCNSLLTSYSSLGENIESTTPSQCGLGVAGDQIGVDPLLGPLALNGLPVGSPETRALLAGSPALDSVPSGGSCPATDQRGVARPQGAACDAGAFEVTVDPPPTPPQAPPVSQPLKKKKCKKGFVKKKVKGKLKCVKKKPKKK